MHESEFPEGPEPPLHRTETLAILGALADIQVDVHRILLLLEGYDDGEAEEDEENS